MNTALRAGENPVWAANVALMFLISAGVLEAAIYCFCKMRKNRGAALYFAESTRSNWRMGILIRAFCHSGLMLYGLVKQRIGMVTRWPLIIGAIILSSTAVGFLTGEWKSAERRAKAYLCIVSPVIIAAVIFAGMTQSG